MSNEFSILLFERYESENFNAKIIFSLRKEKKRRIFHVFIFEKDKNYDYKFSEKRLRKIRNFPYDHQSIYRENRFIICNIQFITSSCWNE